jgi:hypothetical protein
VLGIKELGVFDEHAAIAGEPAVYCSRELSVIDVKVLHGELVVGLEFEEQLLEVGWRRDMTEVAVCCSKKRHGVEVEV